MTRMRQQLHGMPAYRVALRLDARVHYWRQVAIDISDWVQEVRPG